MNAILAPRIFLLLTFTGALHLELKCQFLDQRNLLKEELNLFHREESNFSKHKNIFLDFVTRGQELSLLDNLSESNEYFEKAYWLLDSNRHRLLKTDHFGYAYEGFMVLYLKAINFFVMQRPELALVECNRMRDWLNLEDIDLTKDHFNNEVFPHMLLGLLYEIENMPNDALIEYQFSYHLFQQDEGDFFGAQCKEKTRGAILRTCLAAGLIDKFNLLQEEFSIGSFNVENPCGGTLTLVCHLGVGPHQDNEEEPADFETDANSQLGFITNAKTGTKYKFESVCVVNTWRHRNWWTSLPRGIYYVTVPLQTGSNEFIMTTKDSQDLKFAVQGTGSHQLRVVNSFDLKNLAYQVNIKHSEAEIYLHADSIQTDNTKVKLIQESVEKNDRKDVSLENPNNANKFWHRSPYYVENSKANFFFKPNGSTWSKNKIVQSAYLRRATKEN